MDHINPKHYKATIKGVEIEVADIIEAFQPSDGHLAHAITYILRAGHKPDSTYERDINKCIWWCMRSLVFRKLHIELPDFFKPKAPSTSKKVKVKVPTRTLPTR